jgi:3-oxoacyl-[acyl-carrier-protein] synthase II
VKKRVVVTGLGVVSSIGIGKDVFWDNLLKGTSGISEISAFDTSGHATHVGGEVRNFKPEDYISKNRIKLSGRASQFAMAATKMALVDAGLLDKGMSDYTTSVCLGTTMGEVQSIEKAIYAWIKFGQKEIENMVLYQSPLNNIPSAVAMEFKLKGRNRIFTTACASGNYAIGYGYDLLRFNESDIVVAGGSDAFSRVAFTGFNKVGAAAPEKCQPFDKNRKGMILGEGSGIVILESLETAQKRKANIYAEILGYGLSCDAHHMTNPQAEGLVSCMRNAMTDAGLTNDDVDYIGAHGTGTMLNDAAECSAIKEVFGNKKIAVSSIKSMLGHAMGAASALEAIACCLIVKNDVIPPTINYEIPDPGCDIDCVPNISRRQVVDIALNNGFAFGGNNSCLVIKKFMDQ